MSHPRKCVRPATSVRSSTQELKEARESTTGSSAQVHDGSAFAEVPLSMERSKWIADAGQVLGKVILSYADAAAKAKRTGRTHTLTYTVNPYGGAVALAETPLEEAENDPLDVATAKAKARGAMKVTEILKTADMLTARDFGPLIGASHETVNVRRKRHEILGLEGTTRGVKYPRWQVTDAGLLLPGLPRLFAVLGDQPWTVYHFLRAEHAELGGRTALDALKAGQVDAVVGVAESSCGWRLRLKCRPRPLCRAPRSPGSRRS